MTRMGAEGLIVTLIVDSDDCPMPSSTVSLTVWEPGGSLVWKIHSVERVSEESSNFHLTVTSSFNPLPCEHRKPTPPPGNDEQGMSLSPEPRALKAIISEESVTSPSPGDAMTDLEFELVTTTSRSMEVDWPVLSGLSSHASRVIVWSPFANRPSQPNLPLSAPPVQIIPCMSEYIEKYSPSPSGSSVPRKLMSIMSSEDGPDRMIS